MRQLVHNPKANTDTFELSGVSACSWSGDFLGLSVWRLMTEPRPVAAVGIDGE